MMVFRNFICAIVLVLSALVSTGSAQTIPERVDDIVSGTTIVDYQWSILFESEDGSTEYYSREPHRPSVPASNTKMFTTAAAFGLLGTDHVFETRIYHTGTLSGGVITGDIVILSEHDPTWNTSVFGSGNANRALRVMAAAVKSAGVNQIDGNVRGFGAMIFARGSTNTNHVSLSTSNIQSFNQEAADAFRAALISEGVSFTTTPSVTGHVGFTPPGGSTLLHTHLSSHVNDNFTGRPLILEEACYALNKVSHNPMADLLLRHIGYKLTGTDGYTAGANQAISWFASEAGLDTGSISMSDGSGLSRNNRFSARQTVDLTRYMVTNYPSWFQTLPIGGIDGTLSSRFGGALRGRVFAKTGTLPNGGVVSLSGLFDNPNDGQRYYFSIYANTPGATSGGEAINTTATRNAIDAAVNVPGTGYPPFAPELYALVNTGAGNVRVEWGEPYHAANAHHVYTSADGNSFTLAATIDAAYIIESGPSGLNNADYSDTADFITSSAHSTAPGLTPGIGSRVILPANTGTATFTPSALPAGRYRVDVTCYGVSTADSRHTRAVISDARGTRTSNFDLSHQTAGDIWRSVGTFEFQPGQGHSVQFDNSQQRNQPASPNGRMNPAAVRFVPLFLDVPTLAAGEPAYFNVAVEGPRGIDGKESNTYSIVAGNAPADILMVEGFERWKFYGDNPNRVSHSFAAITGDSILDRSFETVSNDALIDGYRRLEDYPIVVWVLGEESTAQRSFNPAEQALVAAYRATGGGLFVSGSEIAWDLDRDSGPTAADRAFIRNHLFAILNGNINDDAGTYQFAGTSGTFFSEIPTLAFDDGTSGTYDVDYPDVLTPVNGGFGVLEYVGGRGGAAAVAYDGSAGGGRVVYLGFPFETILSKQGRDDIMEAALRFLQPPAQFTGWILLGDE